MKPETSKPAFDDTATKITKQDPSNTTEFSKELDNRPLADMDGAELNELIRLMSPPGGNTPNHSIISTNVRLPK